MHHTMECFGNEKKDRAGHTSPQSIPAEGNTPDTEDTDRTSPPATGQHRQVTGTDTQEQLQYRVSFQDSDKVLTSTVLNGCTTQ